MKTGGVARKTGGQLLEILPAWPRVAVYQGDGCGRLRRYKGGF
jgi:hypothetical protein